MDLGQGAAKGCALSAGVAQTKRDGKPVDTGSEKFRTEVDGVMGCLCGVNRRSEGDIRRECADFAGPLGRWLVAREALRESFRKASERVNEHRNRLDHCWTGDAHSREKLKNGALEAYKGHLERAIGLTESVVHEVTKDLPPVGPRDAAAVGQE